MASAAQIKTNNGLPSYKSTNPPSLPGENVPEHQALPTINNVEHIQNGIIKTSKHKANAPYTIVLLGETGVGKSSALEFIANVLAGNDIDHFDFEILDRKNERGGSDNRSRTKEARRYNFTSPNGIVVRVLDTPGFTDTRRPQEDEQQKNTIATQIKEQIDSATAVLVLANGTVPGVTVGTEHALSTLSTVFPETPADNVAFVLTNVSSPLFQNFSEDALPNPLKGAPQFLLNNPVALQKKNLERKEDPNMKPNSRKMVEAERHNAMEMLVDLFDWLDGLGEQSNTKLVPLHDITAHDITVQDITAWMDQSALKKAKHSALLALLASGTQIISAVGIGSEPEASSQPQPGTELMRGRWEGRLKLLRRSYTLPISPNV